jgi:hypothetical protein
LANFKDIQEILIPIFSKYYFTTSKYLDFQDFKSAAEIKKVSYLEKRKLNQVELEKILGLKSSMNSLRKYFNNNNLPKRSLTSDRLCPPPLCFPLEEKREGGGTLRFCRRRWNFLFTKYDSLFWN